MHIGGIAIEMYRDSGYAKTGMMAMRGMPVISYSDCDIGSSLIPLCP